MQLFRAVFLILTIILFSGCEQYHLSKLQRACDQNDADSCVTLAMNLEQTPNYDLRKTINLLEKACSLGTGCLNLRFTYESACDNNDGYSCGKLLSRKISNFQSSIQTDELQRLREQTEIANLARTGCSLNDYYSCGVLGYLYYNGAAIPKDINTALQFAYSSCEQNIGLGCAVLGQIYLEDRFVSADVLASFKDALNLFKKGCDLNDGFSCGLLGLTYYNGSTPYTGNKSYLPQNYNKAANIFQKGCNLNDSNSCAMLASMYHEGKGVDYNIDTAITLYNKSCNLNNGTSCGILGNLYYNDRHHPSNPRAAWPLFEKGCDLNNDSSCYYLGVIYYYNDGFEELFANYNREKSIKLFRKGCNLGNSQACQTIRKLSESTNIK